MNDFETGKLLARWIDGETLADSELKSLKAVLESRPELLDAAADQVMLDRLLEHRVVGLADFPERVRTEMLPLQKVVPFYRRPKVWAAVATVAVAGWVADLVFHPLAHGSVAEITGSAGADGVPSEKSFRKGEILAFREGFVSVRFKDGAEVVIEGEAKFQFLGTNQARLLKGSAVANVPESAHGFTIDGPGGKVVDIGTEFAVKTAGDQMEVHVLKGEVKAQARGHHTVSLKQDRAALVGKSGIASLVVAPGNFLTALPPKHGTSPVDYLHWSFDEGSGLEARAEVRGVASPEQATGRLTSLPGGSTVPEWMDGVNGSAISFSGQDDYVQTEFPGFGGSSARTVSLWVKVPQDLKATEGYALVSWGAHSSPGDTWQVSINPDADDGPVGSLRVGTHEGQVVGTTDLRDGEWHHLSAVLYEGRPANVATHILLYVDGRLEPAARKSIRRVDTDITGPEAQRVAFGKNSAVRSAGVRMPKHTFRGGIDEVTLCPAALSQKEIQTLMKTGRID
jgi:hypothetical protein